MEPSNTPMKAKDVVLSVRNLGKQYRLFQDPQDRLKHMLLWRLGKTYGHPFDAVQDVSFDLHRGEMLAIIGKNGSGKSTLLQMIAGTLTPTQGNIVCNARIGALLELGSGFNPEYSGRENIKLNASILGMSTSEIDSKIKSIIDFADIGEFIDQPVKVYSSGMFVRLAFAVTTGMDSEILLIDEALAVGDIFFRQKCYQRLEELRQQGVSIILVTHAMGDVEQHCERAILLHQGKEIFQGNAPEAVKRYYLVEQVEHLVLSEPASVLNKSFHENENSNNLDHNKIWPPMEAFIDLTNIAQVTNGWARCTGVALCNESGQPNYVFEQGQIACFYYEFELLHNIEVPIGGVQINSEKGIVVHGKTTLEYGTEVPVSLSTGMKIRFCNKINFDISTGEYTFEVGFSTLSRQDFHNRHKMNYFDLNSKVIRITSLVGLGPFAVNFRKNGVPVQLLHHGIANLPGSSTVSLGR